MNKVVKMMLIILGINLAAAGLLSLPLFFSKGEDGLGWLLVGFVLMGVALLVQLIAGIAMAAGSRRPETGKGMLLAVGIIFLIGLSVCSGTMLFH